MGLKTLVIEVGLEAKWHDAILAQAAPPLSKNPPAQPGEGSLLLEASAQPLVIGGQHADGAPNISNGHRWAIPEVTYHRRWLRSRMEAFHA